MVDSDDHDREPGDCELGDGEPDASSTRGRRDRRLTLAIVLCAALAAVSGLTYAGIVVHSRGTTGSPEEASQRFIDTAQTEDPTHLVELLPADEQVAAAAAPASVAAALHRLGFLTTPDGHRVADVSFHADSLRRTTTTLGPDLVAVDLTAGRWRVASRAALPTGPDGSLLADGFVLDTDHLQATRDFATTPLRIVTVATDDGWRVSLALTVAENLRGHPTTSEPAPTPTPAATGASSPQDAVREVLTAYAAADPDQVRARLEPDEATAMYDLPSLFVPPDPRRLAAAAQNQDPRTLPIDVRLALRPTATINRLELSVTGDGAERQVRIDAVDETIDREVQIEHLAYDGSCLTAEYRFAATDPEPYARFRSCADQGSMAATTDPDRPATTTDPDRPATVQRPPRDNVLSSLAIFGTGGQLPVLTVRDRDGKWYLSPARSIAAATVTTVTATDPDQVGAFLGRVRALTLPDTNQAAKETTDPDNSLFGPRAVANNRLIAACFVEVMNVVGEEASADPSIECITHLAAIDKVRTDAVAPMLLGDCYHAEPTAPPADDNPYRRLYLSRAATRACFQTAVDQGVVPSYTVANHLGREQGCFARYDQLDRAAPEAQWSEADAEVKTCVDHELQQDPEALAPGPSTNGTASSVDPASANH